jgi:hypothetical protein
MSGGGRCTARAEINVIGGKHSVTIANRSVSTPCRDGTGEICPTGGGRYVIDLLIVIRYTTHNKDFSFSSMSAILPRFLTHTPGPTWSVAGHSLGRATSNRVGRLFEKEIQAVYRGRR